MGQTRPKVAYVPSHLPSYYAHEYDVFGRSRRGLERLAKELDFELLATEPVVSGEEAGRARRGLEAAGVDFVLLQNSTFAMGDVVTQFAGAGFRLGLWAVEEPTHEGPVMLNNFVSLNLNAGVLRHYFRQRPPPYKWFFGLPEHPWFAPRLGLTVAALRALKRLRGSRIALVGDVAPTFYNFVNDPRQLGARLGAEVTALELDEVFRRMPGDSDRLHPVMEAMARYAQGRVEISRADLESTAGVYLALRGLALEGGFAALAVSDWPRFQTQLGIHPGMAFSWLDEADGVPVASEGDALGAVTMLMLRAVSGQAALLLDFTDLDLEQDAILAWHCGGSPLSLADTDGVIWKNHSTLGRKVAGAAAMGAVADFRFRPQPVTLARVSGDTERLFFAEAEAFEGRSRGFEGSRGWLRNFQVNRQPSSLADLVNTVMVEGIEHHFGLVAGQHADALAELAAWSGLRPIAPVPYRDFMQHPTGA